MNKNKFLLDNRGVILFVTFLVIVVLSIVGIGMYIRMITEARSSERHKELTEAFYLAEAAIDKAITKLPSDTTPETGIPLGAGRYSLVITTIEANKKWKVRGYGYVPNLPPNARATKTIEAYLTKKDLEDNFWDNAIYSAGDVSFVGNSYTVNGNVRYADDINGSTSGVTPPWTCIEDPDISPLASLYYDYLKDIATNQIKPNGQNNLYTADDIEDGKAFPPTFWFTRGDDGVNNDNDSQVDEYDEWIPNVVYVETDLIIRGNLTAGGFIIVGGNIVENVELFGNVSVDGCIYTRGYFENRGGGNVLNVNGGVWAGNYATLRGNAKIDYNKTYMDAIRMNINPSTEVQMISWREE